MFHHARTTLKPAATESPRPAASAAPAHVADAGQVLRVFGRAVAAVRASRLCYAEHAEAATQ